MPETIDTVFSFIVYINLTIHRFVSCDLSSITSLKMAASKLFSDKKKEFADFAIPAMKIDSAMHQSERRLTPLIFQVCNGGYPWSFTDAFIQYRKQKITFIFDLWYMFSYKKLIDVLAGDVERIANDDRPIFECLFDFLSGKSEVSSYKYKNILLALTTGTTIWYSGWGQEDFEPTKCASTMEINIHVTLSEEIRGPWWGIGIPSQIMKNVFCQSRRTYNSRVQCQKVQSHT